MKKFIFAFIISILFFPVCFASEKVDWEKFDQSTEKISDEAVKKADIATQKEWDKLHKQQQKEIDEMIKIVKELHDMQLK